MRKLVYALGLTLCFNAVSCAQISQYAQPGGLVTAHPAHVLSPNDFQDLQDVFTDNPGYIEARGGLFTVYTITGPVQQQYDFITLTNQKYRIIKSSAQLGYIDTDNTYKLLLSTLPVNARLWKMSLRNECYLGTDQIGDRWQFQPGETTKLLISTYIPCGKYGLVAGDKGFMVNISTPMTNDRQISVGGDESIVLYSQIGDLRDWGYVNGGTSQWLAVNRNDGETLTGVFVQSGNLCVTKKHLLGTLVGIWNDDTTDGERFIPLNTNIGAVSQDSIVTLNGMTYFTSSDGEVEFNGTSYRIISDDVQDDIEDMAANAGALTGEARITDTSAADFGAGTGTNIDTTTVAGSVILQATSDRIDQQNSGGTDLHYHTMATTTGETYQEFKTSYTLCLTTVAIYGSKLDAVTTITVFIAKANDFPLTNDVILASQTISIVNAIGGDAWLPVDFSTHSVILTAAETYRIRLETRVGRYRHTVTDYRYTRGNYRYDNSNADDHSMLFRVYQRFYDSLAFTYVSQKHQTTGWQQWTNFGASFEPTTSGNTETSIIWYVSAATATALCSTDYLVRVSTGQNIAISSGTWVLWYATGTTTNIGVSPRIDDVTFTYAQSGLTLETTLTAYPDELNNRLWVSGIGNGSTKNNLVYVYQGKTQKWTKLNLNTRSFLKFNNKVYIGDSSDGTAANIWEYSGDYTTDNGTAIEPMIHTPDYIPSGRNKDSKYKSLWVYTDPSSVYPNLTLDYYINKSDTAYKSVTLSQAPVSGYENMTIKHKVPSDLEFARFRYISFKFANFTRLYGFDFNYESRPEGER